MNPEIASVPQEAFTKFVSFKRNGKDREKNKKGFRIKIFKLNKINFP